MREAVDKRQNRVALKQQSLTFAGMGHIGQLMGADVQLLGQVDVVGGFGAYGRQNHSERRRY